MYRGGKSKATFEALWWLHDNLPLDQHKRAFLPSDSGKKGCRLLLIRTDNMTIATEDMHGEYGAEVFILRKSPYFERFKALYKAVKSDNKTEPLCNALELSQ